VLSYYNKAASAPSLNFLPYFESLLRLEWFIDLWDVGSPNDFLSEELYSSGI
jgi:hypothetical protein